MGGDWGSRSPCFRFVAPSCVSGTYSPRAFTSSEIRVYEYEYEWEEYGIPVILFLCPGPARTRESRHPPTGRYGEC